MLINDIEITATDTATFQPVNTKTLLVGDSLLVFQFDEDVKTLLEGDLYGKVNSINLVHLVVESSLAEYKKNLAELIHYIIFYQQNSIVFDNLFIMNKSSRFHQAAIEAVNENQRKITKNDYALWPVANVTCFNQDITGINFVISDPNDNRQSYFADDPSRSTWIEETLLDPGEDAEYDEPYVSDGAYYEWIPGTGIYVPAGSGSGSGSSGSGSGGSSGSTPPVDMTKKPDKDERERAAATNPIQFKRIWQWESYTFPIKGMYAKSMGLFMSSVMNRNSEIVVKRKMRPDEFLTNQD